MKKEIISRVLLAMKDSSYLKKTEWNLFSRLGNSIALECVTDSDYLEQICREKQERDIWILDVYFYERMPEEKQDIVCVIVKEEAETDREFPHHIRQITKRRLVEEICVLLKNQVEEQKDAVPMEKTEGILCYSPIGGCGKTVMALALAEKLSSDGYQVLYVNAENIQNFQYYLECRSSMSSEDLLYYICNQENNLYLKQKNIGHDQFDYLLPLDGMIPAMGIEGKAYADFMERLLNARTYDYIVFDCSPDLNETGMRLVEKCSRVIMITGESEAGSYKVTCVLDNLDHEDDKFRFVSNAYYDSMEKQKKTAATIPRIHNVKGRELVHEIARQTDWKGMIG